MNFYASMYKTTGVCLLVLCSVLKIVAQQSLSFQLVYNSNEMLLEQPIKISDTSDLTISTLKMYVSNFTVFTNGSSWVSPKSVRLIDFSDPSTTQFQVPFQSIDSVFFEIGTDSITNVSQDYEGDLDPVKGMYWSWNTGYIHFKLEGAFSFTSYQQPFEYHLGGYLPPFSTKHLVRLTGVHSAKSTIQLDLQSFLNQAHVLKLNQVMVPGNEAVVLAIKLPQSFKIQLDER